MWEVEIKAKEKSIYPKTRGSPWMFWCLAFWSLASINAYALAPPPMVSEKEFMELVKRVENGEDLNDLPEDPQPPESPKLFALGCIVLASIIFWVWLIGYLFWRQGILIDATIVALFLFLIIHVWWTFKKK